MFASVILKINSSAVCICFCTNRLAKALRCWHNTCQVTKDENTVFCCKKDT